MLTMNYTKYFSNVFLWMESGTPVTFIATAQAFDDEVSDCVQKHMAERPADWRTVSPIHAVVAHANRIRSEVVVLDCVTLLVLNVLNFCC